MSKVIPFNLTWAKTVKFEGHNLESTNPFTYLGSFICYDGNRNKDFGNSRGRARATIVRMMQVWTSGPQSTETKLKIYRSYVLLTLLCSYQC